MQKRSMRVLMMFAVLMSVFGKNAFADWRRYVWTYEYMTMAEGTKEVEYYFTTEIPDSGSSNVNTMKHYLELEYGITDHWDIAGYLTYKQKNTKSESDIDYDGFKIRTRYRFGEKNKYLLDPLLYLEYKKDNSSSTPDKIEAKVILAKDIGDFNFAYNQILEAPLESSGKAEHEYAAGASYALNSNFKVGVESTGNYTDEKYYLGPTVSFAKKSFWTSVGIVWGLNDRSNDIQTRIIVALPF